MRKQQAANLLATLDLGTGVAESDDLLEAARVETSVFEDLLADKVDLVPGTKGSGKTALYRIFVDFLPDLLLGDRRVVIAHGVRQRQDTVFLAHSEQFDKLSEDEFIDFWCIYLISLAYGQFIRSPKYGRLFVGCKSEISSFKKEYKRANIPELERKQPLQDILAWVLVAVKKLRPSVSWTPPEGGGQFEFALTPTTQTQKKTGSKEKAIMPVRITRVIEALDSILRKSNLSLWLMIDQLDVIFARRSKTERRALRGLLRTLGHFNSDRLRIKIFLRDDIFHEITSVDGFTALSHLTARSSDTLRWSEDQILTLLVRRIFASKQLRINFDIDEDMLRNSIEYQRQRFYKVFSDTVYRPPNQSKTLRWIYNHTKDGRGVVTPRDVILLLTRACQRQRDQWKTDPEGETDRLVLGPAIIYGLEQLSIEKRNVYLEAEFPHKWPTIRKLVGGGTEYSEKAIKRLFGRKYQEIVEDLLSLGIVERSTRRSIPSFIIPFLYRRGLECTRRFVSD